SPKHRTQPPLSFCRLQAGKVGSSLDNRSRERSSCKAVIKGPGMATVRLERDEVDNDSLPDVCMVCGAEATLRKRKSFSWHPPWVILLILISLWPYIIVALILTKRMTVRAPPVRGARKSLGLADGVYPGWFSFLPTPWCWVGDGADQPG